MGGSSGSSSSSGGDSVQQAEKSSSGSAQAIQLDPALASFAAAIEDRRFMCTKVIHHNHLHPFVARLGSGNVWVSKREAIRIAEHLHLGLSRFAELYTLDYTKIPGWWLLKNDPKSGEARNCIFLNPDNTCAIHSVRPIQCSTYPWWPELRDQERWDEEKREICEGFDHPEAPETDLAEAAAQLRIATAHDIERKLAFPPPRKSGKKSTLQSPEE